MADNPAVESHVFLPAAPEIIQTALGRHFAVYKALSRELFSTSWCLVRKRMLFLEDM